MADQVTNVFCTSHFTSNEFELLYVEQLVPKEGDRSNISWSSCNYYFGKRGGYAGIQHQQNTWNEGVQFEYNNICSIWDLEDQSSKSNLQPEVELTHKIQGVYSTAFKNQGGSGLHTSHPMPWSPNQWYATVIRRWYIPGESKTRAAMFMYSYAEKKWTKYVSFAIPGADLPLTGNDCVAFLQRFSGNELGYRGVYGQHFRMLKDGSWEKPQHYVASASAGDTKSWKAELYQGVNIELTAGGKFDNQKNEHTFHPNQFDKKPKPAMLTPTVTKVKAHYVKEQQAVRVEWEIAEDRPPQLSHSIKVYKDGLFVSNPPVATNSDDASGKRIISLFQAPSTLKPGTYSTNIEIQVEWEITEDQPPKLSHRIKVQKDGVFVSDPVATNSDSVPEKRSTFFQTPRSLEPGTYWTSIEITDIFNQKSNLGYTSFVVN